MKWTKEMPTIPGWYWYKETAHSVLRMVYFEHLGTLKIPYQRYIYTEEQSLVSMFNPCGFWIGPIEEPPFNVD